MSDDGCKIERYDGSGTLVDPYLYRVPDPNRVNCPVNHVSWGDAARFSNWLHNGQPTGVQDGSTTEGGSYALNGAISDAALMAVSRDSDATWVIPSENEWYKAAYHDKNAGLAATYFDYPTSTNDIPSKAIINPDPGNNANFDYAIGPPYYMTPVGEFKNSQSPYGTFDQGGNLGEWNETVVGGTSRGVRGGGYYYGSTPLGASYRSNLLPARERPALERVLKFIFEPRRAVWT